jgi:ATP-binding cassette subfamily F protein 3
MRVLLAKMLLEDPDVLLLDEPTNHLDLPSIQWLENYLKTFRGITIIVSHDRYFLDRIVDKILEISLKQLHEYAGNYTFFLQEKEIRKEQAQRAYENQQKYIEEQERFINRFRAKATKARQAQSKLKQLEKLERLEAPEDEGFDFNLRFEVERPSGKEVSRLRDISKAYDDKVILRHSDATIMRGDKIALIGANGLGKSTLLRIIAGAEPFEGSCEEGHHVSPTFFAQHQLEALNLKHNILEEVASLGAGLTEAQLRNILGCFMFSGDEVEKPIKVLSGGEKSRVALAKTLISKANFLLLDEPTNHLDIPSIQVLVQALNAYEGTFIVVSHDRYFLEKVANKIWFIENRKLKEYPGTYQEYEYWLEKRALQENGSAKASPEPAASSDATAASPSSGKDYQRQKQVKNRIRKLQRDVGKLEEKITKKEKEKEEAILELARPEMAAAYEKLAAGQQVVDQLQAELEALTEEWEAALLELEELGEEVL